MRRYKHQATSYARFSLSACAELLRSFKETLAMHISDRDRLERELEAG
jgi:hypothetical protein